MLKDKVEAFLFYVACAAATAILAAITPESLANLGVPAGASALVMAAVGVALGYLKRPGTFTPKEVGDEIEAAWQAGYDHAVDEDEFDDEDEPETVH